MFVFVSFFIIDSVLEMKIEQFALVLHILLENHFPAISVHEKAV